MGSIVEAEILDIDPLFMSQFTQCPLDVRRNRSKPVEYMAPAIRYALICGLLNKNKGVCKHFGGACSLQRMSLAELPLKFS